MVICLCAQSCMDRFGIQPLYALDPTSSWLASVTLTASSSAWHNMSNFCRQGYLLSTLAYSIHELSGLLGDPVWEIWILGIDCLAERFGGFGSWLS